MAPLEEMHQMRPKTRCTVNFCRNDQIQRNRWSTVSKISQCGYIQRLTDIQSTYRQKFTYLLVYKGQKKIYFFILKISFY